MPIAKHILQVIISAKDEASKAIKGLQGNLKAMQPAFRKMALYGGIAFGAIGAGIWKVTQSAVESQEILSKFATVFDEVSIEAEAVAMDLRDSWGLATSTAKDLLSATGDLLSGFGFTGKAALDLSEKTQKLAIDLASFTNLQGGSARASEIITKALLGERESLISLGVKILDVDVKQRLLLDGKDKLIGMALRQAKAEITLQLIIEQSGKAIGDYERTSESAANQQRLLQERIKELSEEIGDIFIPILQDLIKYVVPLIKKVSDWVKENPKLTKTLIVAALAIAGVVTAIGLMGMVIPSLITGIHGIGIALTWLAANPIVLLLAALAYTGIVIYKIVESFREFSDEVGGMGNAWSLTFKSMKEDIIRWAIRTLEMLNVVYKHIPILNIAVGLSLNWLRGELIKTEEEFYDLSTSVSKYGSEVDDLSGVVADLAAEMPKLEEATEKASKGAAKAFSTAVGVVKSLRDEIRDAYREMGELVREHIEEVNEVTRRQADALSALTKSGVEEEADIRARYEERMVKAVAEAEEDIEDLKERAREASMNGDREEANELLSQIAKKEDMVARFYTDYKHLEDDLDAYKKYLAMDELARLAFEKAEKISLAQSEYLEKKAILIKEFDERRTILMEEFNEKKTILERELANRQRMHDLAIEMIGVEKMAAIEAEIAKAKTFKEKLEEKILGLKDWMTDSIEMYKTYVGQVNALLSQIKGSVVTGIGAAVGVIGSRQFGGEIARTGAYLLHKGETVVPAMAGAGAGGITVNINGGMYLDEDSAEKIGDLIIEKLKTQIRL